MTMKGFVTSRNPMNAADLQSLKVTAISNGEIGKISQPAALYAHIDGDSYPPTTSGNITEDEDVAHNGHFSRQIEHQQSQFAFTQRAQKPVQRQPVQQRRPSQAAQHMREQASPPKQPIYATSATRNRAIPVMPAMLDSEADEANAGQLDLLPEDFHDHEGDLAQHLLLDYDQVQLFALPFEALKTESFDEDPRSILTTKKGSLIHRLRTLTPDDTPDRIFDNVTTADWEDAGKWILDQLAEATEALVAVRKDMRQVSLSHEAQLEKKHLEIMTKHEKVMHAMTAMRKQGLAMLTVPH